MCIITCRRRFAFVYRPQTVRSCFSTSIVCCTAPDDYGITTAEELADRDLLPDSDLADIIGLSVSQIAALRARVAVAPAAVPIIIPATVTASRILAAAPPPPVDLWDVLASPTGATTAPRVAANPATAARTAALPAAATASAAAAGHPVHAFFRACGLGAFGAAAVHYGYATLSLTFSPHTPLALLFACAHLYIP